jgi:hypothetical protein
MGQYTGDGLWARAAEAVEMYANCAKDSLKLTLEL